MNKNPSIARIQQFIRNAYGTDSIFDCSESHVIGAAALIELNKYVEAYTGIKMSADKSITIADYATEFDERLTEKELKEAGISSKLKK